MAVMKTFGTIMTAAAAICAVQVCSAEEDYWAPQKMAKRQCASVHLRHESSVPHTVALNTVVVQKSAPGTYFCTNCFNGGYIGIQELGDKDEKGNPRRKAIFSIWDAKCNGDDPHAAPEEERAKLLKTGPNVETRRFGGEGTGGNSMCDFAWKEGEPIRTLVVETKEGENFRVLTGYIYSPSTKKWQLLSSWRVQAISTGLQSGGAFVEDFKRNVESKEHERRATFGPNWRWSAEGGWAEVTRYAFTRDGNPNTNIDCRPSPATGYFSLATGGSISAHPNYPLNGSFDLPAKRKPAPKPGEDVMKLIKK